MEKLNFYERILKSYKNTTTNLTLKFLSFSEHTVGVQVLRFTDYIIFREDIYAEKTKITMMATPLEFKYIVDLMIGCRYLGRINSLCDPYSIQIFAGKIRYLLDNECLKEYHPYIKRLIYHMERNIDEPETDWQRRNREFRERILR